MKPLEETSLSVSLDWCLSASLKWARIVTHVCAHSCVYRRLCTFEFVLAHVDVCVQYVEVEPMQSKVLSSLFEGSSNGFQRAGGLGRVWAWYVRPAVPYWLITVWVWLCMCVPFTCMCLAFPWLVQSAINPSTHRWTLCSSSFLHILLSFLHA